MFKVEQQQQQQPKWRKYDLWISNTITISAILCSCIDRNFHPLRTLPTGLFLNHRPFFAHKPTNIYIRTQCLFRRGEGAVNEEMETINHSIGIQHSTLLPSNKNKLLMNHISRVISIARKPVFWMECVVIFGVRFFLFVRTYFIH